MFVVTLVENHVAQFCKVLNSHQNNGFPATGQAINLSVAALNNSDVRKRRNPFLISSN